jgi:hypothetical protein
MIGEVCGLLYEIVETIFNGDLRFYYHCASMLCTHEEIAKRRRGECIEQYAPY